MKVNGKTVVIVGATGGIGSCLTHEFAKNGAALVLVGRNKEKLENLLNGLSGNHKYFLGDLRDNKEAQKCAKRIAAEADSVDILINAVGIGIYKPVEDITLSEWNDSLSLNVTAPFVFVKELSQVLKKTESVVISMGSGMGKIPTAGRVAYCTSKFALRGMSLSLSEEFKGTGVHMIHITLGSTLTSFGPMTLKEKEKRSLGGKAYFTPIWVAKRIVKIIKDGQFDFEIEIYPSDYKEER